MNRRIAIATLTAAIFAFSVASMEASQAQTTTATPTAAATVTATGTITPTAQPFTRLNLNTATDDQFSTIPKVNARWLKEFNEYRPYASITQFRKEISKYVGDDQTAEWEKYLFVPVVVDKADAATLQQIPGVTAEIAKALIAARPYGSNEAFLIKLAALTSPAQAIYGANYLDGKVTIPAALTGVSTTPTATVTVTATPTAKP